MVSEQGGPFADIFDEVAGREVDDHDADHDVLATADIEYE